jgi:hypothetical protein
VQLNYKNPWKISTMPEYKRSIGFDIGKIPLDGGWRMVFENKKQTSLR